MTDDRLSRSTPEAQGIASSAILSFLDAADERVDALHSLMLTRHGRVVAEGAWHPYRLDVPHMLFSLTKSVTSTAVGLAVGEGLLSVDDPVLGFFPDLAPAEPDANLAAMRVRHLLSMTSGHDVDTSDRITDRPDRDWVAGFLSLPVEHAPGTHFAYNSGASHVLSAIVQRLTGTPLVRYLRPRLFDPLGIGEVDWETCPLGINTGGWGLTLRTEDIARFGQLYLDGGAWNGRQVIPREWVREATRRQADNEGGDRPVDWQQGYGYQFWRCRHGAYRGDGAFGQFCVVLPDRAAVLSLTGGLAEMQVLLELIWEHLLPAMGDAPLPDDPASRTRLADRLAALALPTLSAGASPADPAVDGRTYRASGSAYGPEDAAGFAGREVVLDSITVASRPDGWVLTLRGPYGTHEFVCLDGRWSLGELAVRTKTPEPVATTGAWCAPDTFEARVCLLGTPFVRTFTLRFDGPTVVVAARDNVAFGPTDHPAIVAVAG